MDYAPLDRGTEIMLVRRWRDEHDRDAYDRLILSQRNFILRLIRPWLNRYLEQDDLIQQAWYGLIEAVKRFDPERGFRLQTYAHYWILAYIRQYRDQSLKRIRQEIGLQHPCCQDEENDLTLEDMLPAPNPDLEHWERNFLIYQGLQRWGRSLTKSERFILRHYYLEQPPLTMRAIGTQLGISRERVRQLLRQAMQKIDHHRQKHERK